MQFSTWAAGQVKDSNRAKEPGYVRELATAWRMKGETASKIYPGYGKNKPFHEAMKDDTWLPEFDSERDAEAKQRIDALFAAHPETAKKWAAKFDNDIEYGKRAYLKQEMLMGLGPHKRSSAGGTE